MAINGKDKGNTFERKVAKLFTDWWTRHGLTGSFYRTPCSGALAYRQEENVIGDICTPSSFPFTIETKNQERWKLEDLFNPETVCVIGKGGLSGWWAQACREADLAGKFPLLIIKKNFYEPLALFPAYLLKLCFVDEDRLTGVPCLFRMYDSKFGEHDGPLQVLVISLANWLELTNPAVWSSE